MENVGDIFKSRYCYINIAPGVGYCVNNNDAKYEEDNMQYPCDDFYCADDDGVCNEEKSEITEGNGTAKKSPIPGI
jgi:hypothetical protein